MARRKKTEKRELSHEDIPRNTRATARRLLGRMARQWWKLLLVAGAALLSSASFTAIPLAVGMGIDRLVDAIRAFDGSAGVVETAAGALGLPVLLVAAAALFSSLMSYVQQYIIATVGEELTLSLRQDVSAKLNRLPLRYFDGHKTGDIMSRVTNDLEKVSSVMQVGLMQLVSSVFTIALAAAAMVMLSPRLFLVVLVSLALSMTATGYVSALAQRAYGGNMAAMGALTGKVEELYAGNRVVKVFNRQAAMLEEAEKYLGYPYVWGGSSPSTSFDCSGFVSWVINHSGWDVGRLGAQGLCNICTPVTAANAKPGDLVFFKGTYDTPGVSHCGIYVGNGMMIHAGSPISYANLNTSYWQEHLYCYGRLSGIPDKRP